MPTRRRSLACLLVASMLMPAFMIGCAAKPKGGAGGDFENVQWRLTNYESGGTLRNVPSSATAWIEFKGGKFNGQVLNSYGGSYKAKSNGSMTIGQISTTLIGGPPEIMAVETAYFAALQKTAAYTATSSQLTLYDGNGQKLLEFAKNEVSLVGSWKVTGINNGSQAVVSVIATSTVTMDFAEGGKLSGTGGVNQYTATYTTSGPRGIAISQPTTTRMAGPAELMTQEQEFLSALQAATVYELKGNSLELRDASGALQVSAVSAK